jgi:hypothetical protein
LDLEYQDVAADDDVAIGRVGDGDGAADVAGLNRAPRRPADGDIAGIGVRGWLGADVGHHLFDNDGTLRAGASARVVRVPVRQRQQKLARGESFRAS